MSLEFKSSYDVLYSLIDALYMRPWARILPYFMGIAGGWYYNEYKNQQFSQKTNAILWIVSIFVTLSSHFCFAYRDVSPFISTLVITIGRGAYALSITWIIIATANNSNGWFGKALNFSILQQFKNLSYSFYFLNPIVITILFGSLDQAMHINAISLVIISILICCLK